MALNFKPQKIGVSIPYKSLKEEFDVRADGAVDMAAAEEMAKSDRIANPVVTKDLVYLDGRTGAVGHLIKNNTLGSKDELVTVDILSFNYFSLSTSEQAEFRTEALRRNYAPKGGYRRFATEDDCTKCITDLIRLGRTKSQLKTDLSWLGSRFNRLFDIANTTVIQRRIAQARQLMKENPSLSPKEAGDQVGLSSPDGIVPTRGEGPHDKTFNELKAKQAAVQRTVTTLLNYANSRIKMLRDGKVSGLTIKRLLDHESKQVTKLTKVHQNSKLRVEKELQQVIPNFHTK